MHSDFCVVRTASMHSKHNVAAWQIQCGCVAHAVWLHVPQGHTWKYEVISGLYYGMCTCVYQPVFCMSIPISIPSSYRKDCL